MKNKLSTGVGLLIALVLLVFGLCYGTYSGFCEERAHVTALLDAENGLMDVLSYRAADGFNLCAVARRHLNAQDESLVHLEKSAGTLRNAETLEAAHEADFALSTAVAHMSEVLSATPSFQQSIRDTQYLTMLTADLNNLSGSAAVTTYNDAARAFNAKLNSPLFGALARLLGVQACLLYQ